MQSIRIFRCCTAAIVLEQISHWWVAAEALDGPALCISMRNGKQINLDATVAPDGSDGYAIERGLIAFIERCGRV